MPKLKLTWPAYKALLISGLVTLLCVIPLAILGVIFLVFELGRWVAYLIE